MKLRTKFLVVLTLVLALLLPLDALAQRGFRGGGGGGRSFGGGSFGRSPSISRPSSSGSFGRSGSFGAPRTSTRTQSRSGSPFSRQPAYTPPAAPPYVVHNTYYGGYNRPAHYYGGWSDYSYYWQRPSWYYWVPFHPAFYYNAPYYDNGYYQPGGFSFFRFILGLGFFAIIIAIIGRFLMRGRTN